MMLAGLACNSSVGDQPTTQRHLFWDPLGSCYQKWSMLDPVDVVHCILLIAALQVLLAL